MPEPGTAFHIVSVLFGTLMGYGLGLRSEDRTAALSATIFCAVAGLATWLLAGESATAHAAGAAMSVGGASATGMVAIRGRRPR
ncbi:MAG TPA: hypothetical protein VLB67_05370 [Acidimicrobiia bacterium]|nr:hypothetical protein [Acidimicrobiia bacterium]